MSGDLACGCRVLQKSCEVVLITSHFTTRETEAGSKTEVTRSSSHGCQVAEQGFDEVCWTADLMFFLLNQEINNGNNHKIDLFIGSWISKTRLLWNEQR